MSQRGADDWWQKLYEVPDAGPEPDPGDTLDHRFRSAAGLTEDTPPAPEPPQPPPPRQTPPAPRQAPEEPRQSREEPRQAPDEPRQAPEGPRQAPPAAPQLPPEPQHAPEEPRQVPPAPPQPPPEPRRAPEPSPPEPPAPPADPPAPAPGGGLPAYPALPGEYAASAEPAPAPPTYPPAPGPPPPPGPLRGLVPGPRSAPEPLEDTEPPHPPEGNAAPRDPRAGGATGYALGDVDVPPAPPPTPVQPPAQPSGLPARGRQAPRGDAPAEEVPVPGPVPQPGAPRPPAAERRPEVRHLGDRAPTYAAEPGALPTADPAALDALVPDTALEGARYGTYTLRAASVRGDSARFRGESRRDFLLTARFGTGDDALVLVALAGGDRAAPGAAEAAAELCRTVAAAVGRSQGRLAEDIRTGRRDALRSGLQRLTDRGYGRLRSRAAELGLAEAAYTAGLRGLLLPVDPQCRTRVCFGAGAGGLFRLRSGQWQDLELPGPAAPAGSPAPDEDTEGGFRFRASVARPGDTLLLCSGGLAEPMREEAALPSELAARWAEAQPPGLAAFLADTQLRLKGYADDRTAAAVWEA
ncbi:protein phosphatase 2C domain-containing protein [Streptomyces sp. NPDC054797]